jgi:hypothetical protein
MKIRMVIILVLLFLMCVPCCFADQTIYRDCHVVLIGNCKTMSTEMNWQHWYYKGFSQYFGVTNFGTAYFYVYQNDTLIHQEVLSGDFVSVNLLDSSGVFFWAATHDCFRHFIPGLYVNVQADWCYVNFN